MLQVDVKAKLYLLSDLAEAQCLVVELPLDEANPPRRAALEAAPEAPAVVSVRVCDLEDIFCTKHFVPLCLPLYLFVRQDLYGRAGDVQSWDGLVAVDLALGATCQQHQQEW